MSGLHHYTDPELTDALAKGNRAAFEELFNRYWKQSHYFVKSKVFSDEIAKEIVQDVFTDIWHYHDQRRIEYFSAYLFRALRYKTIKYIRSVINQKKYWDHYSAFIPKEINQTELDISYEMLVDALEKGLNNLPEKTQTVFRLNRLEGKSLAEISSTLNLTEKAIQYHLTKSIRVLRIHLKDYISLLFFLQLPFS